MSLCDDQRVITAASNGLRVPEFVYHVHTRAVAILASAIASPQGALTIAATGPYPDWRANDDLLVVLQLCTETLSDGGYVVDQRVVRQAVTRQEDACRLRK